MSGMAYTALEHPRLGGCACGPRHWLRREIKCLVKSSRDFGARPGLSSLSSHALSPTTSKGAVPVYHHLRHRGASREGVFLLVPSKADRTGAPAAAAACSISWTRSGEHLFWSVMSEESLIIRPSFLQILCGAPPVIYWSVRTLLVCPV